jgi:hypothetical protein
MPSHQDRVRKNYDDKPTPKKSKSALEHPPATRAPDVQPDKKG